MKTCYIDESGDGQTIGPTTHDRITPVVSIVGVIIESSDLSAISREFIELKKEFFPRLSPRKQDQHWVLREIKGSSLVGALRPGSTRNEKRHTLRFLDSTLSLLESYDAKLVGRVWVKKMATPFTEMNTYTSSIQSICGYFENHLTTSNKKGMVICDHRSPELDSYVSHSIYTQRFALAGDPYAHILEMPTFGHSQNHVGLQLTDIVVSAIISPIACSSYLDSILPSNIHVRGGVGQMLKNAFGLRLRGLQYMYPTASGIRGGIVVSDPNTFKSSRFLFKD